MRIAFIIVRMNYYRLMAPAIDAALSRGWHVECWHDIGTPMPMRPLDFPSIETVPYFSNGAVTFREYQGIAELPSLMGKKLVDVVVNLIMPVNVRQENWPDKCDRSFYVCLEPTSTMDIFINMVHPEEVRQVDMFALTTPYRLEQCIQVMKMIKRIPFTNQIEEEIRQKSVIVGWPQIDQLSLIDPKEVRHRWGIPEKQPVVVYLNWPDASMHGLRQALFSATSLKQKLAALARFPKEWLTALSLLCEPNLGHIGKAVRTFCDRNGAYLLVKCRHRDKVWPLEERIADRVVYDESYYPHTILEVMSIADLCMGYFSYGVRESVAAHTPYLVLDVAGLADIYVSEKQESILRMLSRPGGFFNYAGATHMMDAAQITHNLHDMSIADFHVNPHAQTEYFDKYLGVRGTPNADLFMNAVQGLIEKERGTKF